MNLNSQLRAIPRAACSMRTLSVLALLATLAACTTAPMFTPSRTTTDTSGNQHRPEPLAATPLLQRLMDEAAALQTLAESTLARNFLAATRALPAIRPRTVFMNESTREYYSAESRNALPPAVRAKLAEVSLDEERYYYTKYGSPLAYVRVLDIAAANGIKDVAGLRILDFGYGSIGHLRLLASLGAHTTGIDPDGYLEALYAAPFDQGSVPPASGRRRGPSGTISLAHGLWPKDARMVERVGQGYDLILSKNTLKKGYIHPEKKIDKRQQIVLGVTDDTFLKAMFDALKPGGKLIIYNLAPKEAGPKEKYNPQADARSPWTREQYEKNGFVVTAYNNPDHIMARNMGRALHWDREGSGNLNDLETNLFALVTIVMRPA